MVGISGFDNTRNSLMMESIRKEDWVRRRHETTTKLRSCFCETAQRTLETGGVIPPTRVHSEPQPRSAAVRFLEEKLDLDIHKGENPTMRDMLYCGVSREGQGRAQYLIERRKCDVLERYGRPLTETHNYGLVKPEGACVASAHCKKPIIQRSLYRTQGVDTYKDLPGGR